MGTTAGMTDRYITISTAAEKRDYCRTAVLFYVLEGDAKFAYHGHESALKKGDILILNRDTEYEMNGSGDLMVAALELAGKEFESVCDGILCYARCDSSADQNEHYAQLRAVLRQMIWNRIHMEEAGKRYAYLEFGYGSLYYRLLELIAAFFIEGEPERQPKGGARDKNEQRKREIERYLSLHYMEPLSLEDVSQEICLSQNYLSRFFSRRFGVTFSQYLKEIRLKHAMNDLLYTDDPITQIALDNGFSGSSYFNRVFREKFQKNPTEVRREFQKKNRVREKREDREAIRKRVQKLLDLSEEPAAAAGEQSRYSCSAAKSHPFGRCWDALINIGSAAELLRTDVQSHLAMLGQYYRYARFWTPFSEEMLLSVNSSGETYNFKKLDQVIGSVLSCGMKPFIVFEPKMEKVNAGIDTVIVRAEHDALIRDPGAWEAILHALVRHLVLKYGEEEVGQWKFELVYGGYRLQDADPKESFLDLLQVMTDTVRAYSENLMIGGPALPSAAEDVLPGLFAGMRERGSVPDFLSMISFAYESDADRHKYSVRSMDEDFLLRDVTRFRRMMEKSGLGEIPLYITEWNETVADRNVLNDSCYRGAYLVKNLLEINPLVPAAGYFSGTDLRAEYYDSDGLLQGGNGLLNRDGILKPAGFAAAMLHRLGQYRIAGEKQFLVTTDRHDNYYVMAHNKRRLSVFYYKTPEERIEKEGLSRYYEDENSSELTIELTDIRNGDYRIRVHQVNSRCGSILDLWRELGYNLQLSQSDVRYLQRICEPHLLFFVEKVTEHRLTLKFTMEANEIALIEIRRDI